MVSVSMIDYMPSPDSIQGRRLRKYGKVGRMPGVVAVAVALGVVCMASYVLPEFSGSVSLNLSGRSAEESEAHSSRRRLSGECDPLEDWENNGGVIFYFLCMIYIFLGVAIICDEFFVDSLEEITRRLKIPDDVAGATFMAAGSSAPEVATVVISTLINPGDEGLGDVVGAAVFNSMTVVGLCAILAGQTLSIAPYPFTRDSSFYALAIVLLAIFVADGQCDWWEAMLLLIGYLVYVFYMSQNTRVAKWLVAHGDKKTISGNLARKLSSGYLKADVADLKEPDFGITPPTNATMEAGQLNGFGAPTSQTRLSGQGAEMVKVTEAKVKATEVEEEEEEEQSGCCKIAGKIFWGVRLPYYLLYTASMPPALKRAIPNYFFMWQFVMSVVWIAGLTYVMLIVSTKVGCILKIPTVVMGYVIISAGTTVPDCLSSIIVSRAGQGNMAVCNAIGSNIFNIFIGLGLPWFLYTLAYSKPYKSVALEGLQVLISILILVLYLLILLLVLIISKWRLFPAVGFVLITLHLLFIAWALLTNSLGDGDPVINLD